MNETWQPNETPAVEGSDLRDYVRPVWRHKFLILTLVVVATVGTYLYYDRQPRVYKATTTLFVGDGGSVPTQNVPTDKDRVLQNQARLLQ